MQRARPPTPWLARGLALLVVVSLFAPAAIAAVSGGSNDPAELQRGTIKSAAEGDTVVAIQGFHFQGRGSAKKPARLVSVGPRGGTNWVFDGRQYGARWFYDVDPLPNGNLLVVSTNPEGTLVYELDPETKEQVWVEELPFHDTHDVDAINSTHLVIANMRQWNDSCDCPNDRVIVYDRTEDEITWEWVFRNHYPNSTDGGFHEDWTHVNDVDVIGPHRLLVSPRNFDQVIVLNRTSGNIEQRLGTDDNHSILNEQHNPDYLVTENGSPTVLVADSENDRVIEYTKVDGEWTEVWSVGGFATLSWPRDADRLPNGNTLITDTLNHRVIEVTPRGEIVWEYYATWGPYDAERVAHGGGSNGPTMLDQGVTGHYPIHGSAGSVDGVPGQSFAAWLAITASGTPVEGPVSEFATRWSHVTPWARPVWMNSWDFAMFVAGVVVLLGWALAEVVVNRHHIAERARSLSDELVG